MADIKYLNYGNQQVDEQALLTSMANDVQNYVNSQPWSNSRKQKFMTAYSDIMNRGIQGASNNTGQWRINVGGTPYQFDQMDRKDREMYGEAAYFIQQQMNRLATTPKTEEEKIEETPELPKFTSTNEEITHRIGNNLFGGQSYTSTQWRDLIEDTRGENGLFGTTKRREELARQLQLYRDELTSNPVDFTGSAFKDLNDYQSRLTKAIDDLNNSEIGDQELKRSLANIGLNYDDWFNNGSGDIYVDENGYSYTNPNTQKPFTFAEWNNYQNQLNTQKQEQETAAAEAKQKALDALEIYTSKPHQKIYTFDDLANKYGNTDNFIQSFKNKNKQVQNLSQEESDELTSFFYTLNSTDEGKQYLQDLTDEEWEPLKSKLQPLQSQYGYGTIERNKNQFKKVQDLDGVYYDTVQNTLVQVGQKGQQPLENLFSGLSDKEKEEAEQQRLIFEGSGLSGADVADIAASIVDLAGIGVTFAPVVGNVAGAATGAVGSLTHFGADIARDGLDWGDAGRLGMNLAFDAATLIPGLGTAAKAGKLAKALAPWGPRLIAAFAAYQGLSNGSAITNSFKKLFSNYKSVTVDDLQNMAQGIALLAGGVNASRGIYQNRQAKKSLKPGTSSEPATIKTRNGRTLELNESEYNTLNSKTATREAKQAALESAATRSGTPLESTDGLVYKGRSVTHPLRSEKTSVEIEGLAAPKTSVQGVNIGEIRERNRKWVEEHPTLARILPGKTADSKVNWTNEGMYIRGWKENSTSQQGTKGATGTTEATGTAGSSETPSTSFSRRAVRKEYIDTINKGKFSTNTVQTGDYKVGSFNIKVSKTNDGKYRVHTDVYSSDAHGPRPESPTMKPLLTKFNNQKELQKAIAKIIKESRRRSNLPDATGKRAGINHKEIGKILQELKKKGWLKQGGKITNEQIDKFLQQ